VGLQKMLYDECVNALWDPSGSNTFGDEIAHLHEEVSEAFRAYRKFHDMEIHIDADGKPQGVPIEFADAIIGMFYNAELYGFDLMEAIAVKHEFNISRDYVQEGRQLHG
jgi:hypothetical protein